MEVSVPHYFPLDAKKAGCFCQGNLTKPIRPFSTPAAPNIDPPRTPFLVPRGTFSENMRRPIRTLPSGVEKVSEKNFHPAQTVKSFFGTLFDLWVRPTLIRSDAIGRLSDDHRTALG